MDDAVQKTQWFDAKDFHFGLDTEGRLMISWTVPNGIEGLPRFGVLVPAADIQTLKLGLEQTAQFRSTLSVQAPPTGAN